MISIIIPTYNRAHSLPRAVNSVLNQTNPNWELIIVDDGSTDNTSVIVKDYLKYTNIKYVQKENTGAGDSRNKGAALASFDYIAFLDSDDELNLMWIEEFLEVIKNDNVGIIFCEAIKVDLNSNQPTPITLKSNEKLYHTATPFNFLGGCFLVNKGLFDTIKGYDSLFPSNQHFELSLRLIPKLLQSDFKIYSIKKQLVTIYVSSDDRIRKNWKSIYEGTNLLIKKHKDFLSNEPNALSVSYAVLANTGNKIGVNKYEVVKHQSHAIYYNPFNFKNYLRLLIYFFNVK